MARPYGRVAGDSSALQGARDAFRTARAIYVEKGAERLAAVAEKNLRHVDKATARRREKKVPPELPWEGRGDEPPALPWEFGPGASGSEPRPRARDDKDARLDDRLR